MKSITTVLRNSLPVTSSRPGLGAIVFDGGVAFRVWAPFASQVHVAGTFNRWDVFANPLASEGNGYWSVEVAGASNGDQYRYVLGDNTKSPLHWRSDPRSGCIGEHENSLICAEPFDWQTDSYRMPSWDELVIYELHLGSYLADCHDDRAPLHEIDEMCSHLSRLRDLGINAIEIMPIKEFNGELSWGYNPQHLFSVERAYGGPSAFKRLIDTAHGLGIAVILDVVYNHIGPDNLHESLWQFDEWSENGLGGIYFYNDWRADTGDWGETRPDYGRAEVRDFICDNVLYWLHEFRIDGLRLDMTCYIRNSRGWDNLPPDDPTQLGGCGWTLLQRINNRIDQDQPWKLIVAEDMRQNALVTQTTAHGGLGFDSQWDDQFFHKVNAAIVTPNDECRDMRSVASAISNNFGNAWQRVIYTESHDEVGDVFGRPEGGLRVPEAIHPGHANSWFAQKRSTLGAVVTMTSPGIPMLFQGQEMLEYRQFTGKEGMDWNKLKTYAGIVTLYRDLIRLRRNWYNNTRGLRGQNLNVFHVNNSDKVIAFHRWHDGGPGDDVVVLLNFANRAYETYTLGLPRGGRWFIRFNSDWEGYSPLFDNHPGYHTEGHLGARDELPFHGNLAIGKYSALILSQG